jgi:tetratricopeptide (TPR) repeat protein
MWHDAESSDRKAYAASTAWAKAKALGPTLHNYHALSWLQYELLQLGRYREAWALMGDLEPVVKSSKLLPLLSDLSSMRARYVVETRRWDVLARERNFGNANELFAIGMSAARSGNAPLAEMARQGLAARAQSEREGDLRPAIAIMERQLAALIELAAGRRDDAVEILRRATESELALPAPFGLPVPLKPAPELLGEVLLEIGRPQDARAAFDQALARNRNRSLSVLGLARAAAALNESDQARTHYGRLLATFDKADADLPELKEARAMLAAQTGSPPSRGPGGATLITIGVATGGLLAAVIWRIARRRPHLAKPASDSRAERRRRMRARR